MARTTTRQDAAPHGAAAGNALGAATILLDAAHFVVGADRAALSLTGHTLTALRGRPAAALFGPSRGNPSGRPLAALLQGAGGVRLALYAADGRRIPVRLTAISLEGAGTVCTLEPVETGEALRAERSAERDAGDAVLDNVSHQLRTPLTGILGMAEILAAGELDPAQTEQVKVIRECGATLLGFVDDLLDLQQLGAGEWHPAESELDPREILDEALARCAKDLTGDSVALHHDFDPALPRRVIADGKAIGRVLDHLLANAVRFTATGEIRLRAVVEEESRERVTLRLSVRDTGAGIPPHRHEAIFEPFTRADTSLTAQGGGGLGLTLSRGYVDRMGGRIWVDSDPGWGSEFHVSLPLTRPARVLTDESLVLGMAETEASRTPASRVRPLRVLLVDYGRVDRTIASRLLERHGHTVETVGTGLGALDAWRSRNYDLLVLDWELPDMRACELVQVVRGGRAGDSRKPILGLVSRTDHDTPGRCRQLGLDGCVAKPLDPPALYRALADLFAR